mgnify:CR=1 FL=1
MHRADADDARWRRLHREKIALSVLLDATAFAHAKGRVEFLPQRVGCDVGALYETLGIGRHVGHKDGGAARGPLFVQRFEDIEPHQSTLST